MVAAIGNGAAFAKGRDFAAWIDFCGVDQRLNSLQASRLIQSD